MLTRYSFIVLLPLAAVASLRCTGSRDSTTVLDSDASAPNDDPLDSGVGAPAAPDGNVRDGSTRDGTAPDADATPALTCPQILQAFTAFVAANRACTLDTDCTLIGDCGPHADFTPINVNAATAGYGLMLAREPCGAATFDGKGYRATCEAGQCTQGSTVVQFCCGCPDAGTDGG